MAEVTRTLIKIGHTSDSNDDVFIPDPSSLQWGLQSVSKSDAGRDIKGTMHVELVTRKRKLELSWNGVDFSTAAEILTAVNPETFWVTYHDALSNRSLRKKFYVGDRTAPVHSYHEGHRWYTNVTFNLIEV